MVLYDVATVAGARFRRHRLWTVRRGVVAGGGSPRGDDRLVHQASTKKTGADRRVRSESTNMKQIPGTYALLAVLLTANAADLSPGSFSRP